MHTQVGTILKDIIIKKGKEICLPNKEYLRHHRCERTKMAHKGKIFETVSMGIINMCTVSKVIGINTENKICLPNKECISVHS